MFESTKIIAYKQYYKARQLFLDNGSLMQLRGPVKFAHEHIDMSKQIVPLYKSVIDLARIKPKLVEINSTYTTCQAGLGYSFAAGTTDGPGAFDFQQADTASTRYWNLMRDFLRRPTEQQIRCHYPKPILLSTGEMDFPYQWHPRIIPTQIIMIGQVAIVGLPGEFTTMSGRRVRQAVLRTLQDGLVIGPEDSNSNSNDDSSLEDDEPATTISIEKNGADLTTTTASSIPERRRQKRAYSFSNDFKVVLSGLSNVYSSYITTFEEYQIQRYEGASTLYGPHTLQAYINQFKKLASHLIDNKDDDADDGEEEDDNNNKSNKLEPPDLSKSLFTLKAGVIYDGTQHGKKFGDLINDVEPDRIYNCKELVRVSFVAGNPRNDLRHEDSFLYVDKYLGNGTWLSIATDASWETKFIWERTNTILGESQAIIEWDIPHNCESGVYRIRHYGASKSLLQTVTQYSGQSTPFRVLSLTSNIDKINNNKTTTIEILNRMLESAKQFSTIASNVSGQKRFENEHQFLLSNNAHSSDNHDDNYDVKNHSKPQLSLYSAINALTSIFGNWRHAI